MHIKCYRGIFRLFPLFGRTVRYDNKLSTWKSVRVFAHRKHICITKVKLGLPYYNFFSYTLSKG